MLNIKKIIALNLVAFATLLCLAIHYMKKPVALYKKECTAASASFAKGDNFSIVNILSIKFR